MGSWESYRPDKDEFPRSVIGRRYEGFPDERWLDVAHFHRFEKPLKRRFSMCARKGFDAVEPDNIPGWEPENHTGFRITRADQLRFNRWVARQVHGRGMSIALKNDGRQADAAGRSTSTSRSSSSASSTTNAATTGTFIRHHKAVFEAEYEQKPRQYCKTARALHFSALHKSYDLFARPWQPCRHPGSRTQAGPLRSPAPTALCAQLQRWKKRAVIRAAGENRDSGKPAHARERRRGSPKTAAPDLQPIKVMVVVEPPFSSLDMMVPLAPTYLPVPPVITPSTPPLTIDALA